MPAPEHSVRVFFFYQGTIDSLPPSNKSSYCNTQSEYWTEVFSEI